MTERNTQQTACNTAGAATASAATDYPVLMGSSLKGALLDTTKTISADDATARFGTDRRVGRVRIVTADQRARETRRRCRSAPASHPPRPRAGLAIGANMVARRAAVDAPKRAADIRDSNARCCSTPCSQPCLRPCAKPCSRPSRSHCLGHSPTRSTNVIFVSSNVRAGGGGFCFNEAADFCRRKRCCPATATAGARRASMRPPTFAGGNNRSQ